MARSPWSRKNYVLYEFNQVMLHLIGWRLHLWCINSNIFDSGTMHAQQNVPAPVNCPSMNCIRLSQWLNVLWCHLLVPYWPYWITLLWVHNLSVHLQKLLISLFRKLPQGFVLHCFLTHYSPELSNGWTREDLPGNLAWLLSDDNMIASFAVASLVSSLFPQTTR